MFLKTISGAAFFLSLLVSKNLAVPNENMMYYDVRNLSLKPPYLSNIQFRITHCII